MDVMVLRICVALILLLSVLFMPFWVSLLLAFVGMIFFSFFVEALVALLISDLLFGVKEVRFFNIYFVSLLIAVVMLTIIEIFKTKSSFYNSKLSK